MADDTTPGVLLRGAEGHYFIPHEELKGFEVKNADLGEVPAKAQRVDAYSVQKTTVEAEGEASTAFILAAEHDSAHILAAPGG